MEEREKILREEQMAGQENFFQERDVDKIHRKQVATSPVHATTSKVNLDEQQKKLPEEDTAEQEIDKTESKELMESLRRQRLLCLIFAFIMSVIVSGSTGMVVGFISTLGMYLFFRVLHYLVGQYSTVPYLRTVAVVVEDYVLLVTLNRKFIEIAIIPLTMLAFIAALGSKVSKNQSGEGTYKKSTQLSAKELREMLMVPYWLQLFLVVWTQYKGQVEEGNTFVFSSFLLFLGSALSALTVMIASPPIRYSRGVDQVLPAMHKTCIVMLMLTAHSMATEWLGEDMVLACIPELISVLAWFTIYCHHPELLFVIINRPKSLVIKISSVVAILVVCLGSLFAEDKIILRSWFVRALCISSTSWALSYLDVWLLDRWPAECTPNPTVELVQLLEFSSVFGSSVSACFIAAAHFLSLIQLPFYITVLAMMIGSGLVFIPPLRRTDMERMITQEDRSRKAEMRKAKMVERTTTQVEKDREDRSREEVGILKAKLEEGYADGPDLWPFA